MTLPASTRGHRDDVPAPHAAPRLATTSLTKARSLPGHRHCNNLNRDGVKWNASRSIDKDQTNNQEG